MAFLLPTDLPQGDGFDDDDDDDDMYIYITQTFNHCNFHVSGRARKNTMINAAVSQMP